MKTTAYYIKTTLLSFLLFLESLFLTHYLFEYIKTRNFFTPPIETIATIGLILLALAYTQSLTVGAWGKWTQLLIIPIPLALGVLVVLFSTTQAQAFIIGGLVTLLSMYNLLKATRLSNLLTQFHPQFVLRAPTQGVFTIFSIVAAFIVLTNPIRAEKLNLGEKLGDMINTQVTGYIKKDKTLAPLSEFGLLNLDFKDQIATEVDKFIEPYQNLLTPAAAVLVFALIRGLGSLVHFVYTFSIAPIFWIAKKTKFFNTVIEKIEKERLTFERAKAIETPQSS